MKTSEKVTHTPGPWEWEHIPATPEAVAVSTLRGPLVLCRYWHGVTELPDAALIAAAPEMLETLERIARLGPVLPMTEFDYASVQASIRKAKGEL